MDTQEKQAKKMASTLGHLSGGNAEVEKTPNLSSENTWDHNIKTDDSSLDGFQNWLIDMHKSAETDFRLIHASDGDINPKTGNKLISFEYEDKFDNHEVKTQILCENTKEGIAFFHHASENTDATATSFARTAVKWSIASGKPINSSYMSNHESSKTTLLMRKAFEQGAISEDNFIKAATDCCMKTSQADAAIIGDENMFEVLEAVTLRSNALRSQGHEVKNLAYIDSRESKTTLTPNKKTTDTIHQ